jgi:hypothetical protein
MKIIVDAFGGDNAPLEIIKGCADAVKGLDVDNPSNRQGTRDPQHSGEERDISGADGNL